MRSLLYLTFYALALEFLSVAVFMSAPLTFVCTFMKSDWWKTGAIVLHVNHKLEVEGRKGHGRWTVSFFVSQWHFCHLIKGRSFWAGVPSELLNWKCKDGVLWHLIQHTCIQEDNLILWQVAKCHDRLNKHQENSVGCFTETNVHCFVLNGVITAMHVSCTQIWMLLL